MEEPLLSTGGPPRIAALVAYSKGFACACGSGVVFLYEKTDDKDTFKKTREIRVRVSGGGRWGVFWFCALFTPCRCVLRVLISSWRKSSDMFRA